MKKPLILLPGLLCDRALWQPVIELLKSNLDSPFSTITIPDLTKAESISAMAVQVLEAAPPQFVLGGLSMGGYVAFEIMRQAPQRVTHLMICNSSPNPETEESTKKREATIKLAQSGKFKGVTKTLLEQLVHPSRVHDAAVGTVVLEMAERIGSEAFIRQQNAIMHRADSRRCLATIRCPTLVIVGADDLITPPPIAQEMAASIADSRLVVIPNCGHLPPLEAPDKLVKALLARVAD